MTDTTTDYITNKWVLKVSVGTQLTYLLKVTGPYQQKLLPLKILTWKVFSLGQSTHTQKQTHFSLLYLRAHHKKFQLSSLCGMSTSVSPYYKKVKLKYMENETLAIKKLRAFSFLQLLKFEKAKCPYFCDLLPRSQEMMSFSFEARVVRFKLFSEEEIANILTPGPQIKKVRTLCFLKL